MENKSVKKVKEKFESLNEIKTGNAKDPYIILLDGIIGSGKSTVAKLISEHLQIEVLSNDKIRNFLCTELPNLDFDTREKLVKEIQYPRLKKMLDNKNIVLLDADISENYNKKMDFIRSMGYPYYIIQLICDEKIQKNRILNRKTMLTDGRGSDIGSYSLADYNEYLVEKEKKNFLSAVDIYFTLDTSGNIDAITKQVDHLIAKLLNEHREVISIDKDRIDQKESIFIKSTKKIEFLQLQQASLFLKDKKITIQDKSYKIRTPKLYKYKYNKIYMEKCYGKNLELLLRSKDTHEEATIYLNALLQYFLNIGFYWRDFAPRNIMINDNEVILVDFERELSFGKCAVKEFMKDGVFEEYSAFLLEEERIINIDDIYEQSDFYSIPRKASKRVLTIAKKQDLKSLDARHYYDIIKDIIRKETPYKEENGEIIFPLIHLENLLIQKGYDKYANKIMEEKNMKKEYKPFSNVNGFYINNGYFQSDTGLNLELRKDGFTPKSGLIYNTVLNDCENKTVLDLGCGDLGILGVMARQNGAKTIDSVDIDINCVNWFNHLIKENHFDNMKCYQSDNFSNVKDSFDMILTNLAQMPMINGAAHDSGGFDGRDHIIEILQKSKNYINKDGALYMLLFDFLGVDKRTNDNLSIEELAEHYGYNDMEILESVDKIIKPGSVTYESLEHVSSVYPKYNFNTDDKGNPYCKIFISRFNKK